MKYKKISKYELKKLLQQKSLTNEIVRLKLSGYDLSYYNLENINLSKSDLYKTNLYRTNLTNSNLSVSCFYEANLYKANLTGANLSWAGLTEANLSEANLTKANLTGADLRWTDLTEANLIGADLTNSYLDSANLTNTKGLFSTLDWIKSNLEKTKYGYICYKRIGIGTTYSYKLPKHWRIKKGYYLTEIVNPDRRINHSYGVSFGTYDWCINNYIESNLWKCLIEFENINKVVVPYATDGYARCRRLKLLENLGKPSLESNNYKSLLDSFKISVEKLGAVIREGFKIGIKKNN